MSEKLDGKMSVIDWQTEIGFIAGPYQGNRKGWLARAARKSGTAFRQIKALYYGENKDPKFSVAFDVLKAASEARREAQALASKFESLAGALNAKDQDFHCEDVVALIDAARRLRGVDRA